MAQAIGSMFCPFSHTHTQTSDFFQKQIMMIISFKKSRLEFGRLYMYIYIYLYKLIVICIYGCFIIIYRGGRLASPCRLKVASLEVKVPGGMKTLSNEAQKQQKFM